MQAGQERTSDPIRPHSSDQSKQSNSKKSVAQPLPKIVEITINGERHRHPQNFLAAGPGEFNHIQLRQNVNYGEVLNVEFKLDGPVAPNQFIQHSEPERGWIKTDGTSCKLHKEQYQRYESILGVYAPKERGSGNMAISNLIVFQF